MNIQTSLYPNGIVISPIGDADAYSSIELDQCIESILNAQNKHLLIDGSQLNYISSAGIGVFIKYLLPIKQQGGSLAFANLNPSVLSVFEVLGLNKLVNIFSTLEQAMEGIKA